MLIALKFLFILNDPPYGTERSFNGLRHANAVADNDDVRVRMFLIGDAAACAKKGQETPQGYYNLEKMFHLSENRGIEVAVCGSCMDARGIDEKELVAVATRGSLDILNQWTLWADKLITY